MQGWLQVLGAIGVIIRYSDPWIVAELAGDLTTASLAAPLVANFSVQKGPQCADTVEKLLLIKIAKT